MELDHGTNCLVNTVGRIHDDLVPYQDGRMIPSDILETNLALLELVYRDLLIREAYLPTVALGDGDTVDCFIVQPQVLGLLRHIMVSLNFLYERNQVTHQLSPGLRCSQELVTPLGGRPRFNIEKDQLSSLIEAGFTVAQVPELIGVSKRTIFRRMSEFDLSVRATYTDLTDMELDEIVKQVHVEFPTCGNKQMMGHLLSRGIRVQQVRIRESMRRTDLEGTIARRTGILQRRQYKVPGPRSLFHIDGNHKLIRFDEINVDCCLDNLFYM